MANPLDTETFKFEGNDASARELNRCCDSIDATVFSGDSFVDPQARQTMRNYMARWGRELQSFDRIFPDGNVPEKDGEG